MRFARVLAAAALTAAPIAAVGPAHAAPDCAGIGRIAFNPAAPTPVNSGQFTYDAYVACGPNDMRRMQMVGQWAGTAFSAELIDDTDCEVVVTGTVAAGVFTGSTTYTCGTVTGAGSIDFADNYIRISF